MRSHTELIINSRFIVHPSPLISFFKSAFPLTSSLAQIYFGLFLSLNQRPFILQTGSSSLRNRMGDFASTSCSSLCCSCGQGCHHIEEKKDEYRSLEPCCSGSLSLSQHCSRLHENSPFCYVVRLTWYHLSNPILCIFLSLGTSSEQLGHGEDHHRPDSQPTV